MKDRPTPRRPSQAPRTPRWRPSRGFWWAVVFIVVGSAVALRALVTGQYRRDVAETPTELGAALLIVGAVAVAATVWAAVADRRAGGRGGRSE